MTVLKKAGIVVAVAASGLLVMTPIASAETAPAQASNTCSLTQSGGSITQTIISGGAVVNVVTPVSAGVQALNCNSVNLSNLVNINSGNTTTTSVRNRIVNSFNRVLVLRR